MFESAAASLSGRIAEIEVNGSLEKVLLDVDGNVLAILGETEATLNDVANVELESAIRNSEATAGELVSYGEEGLHYVDSTGTRYKVKEHSEGLLGLVGDVVKDVL